MKYKEGDKVRIIGNEGLKHFLVIGHELDIISTDRIGVNVRGYCPKFNKEKSQYVDNCDIELVQDKIYWP